MSVVVILILASLGVAVAFLGAFIWAVRSDQYEDTMTPAMRVLAEDDFCPLGDPAVPARGAIRSMTQSGQEEK
jgi:cbb3-type cytochrome oxidase maturation protein